ncbi:MAG: SulP family inorganic anion transporter [Chloroflexi bacterium]|nr:SulP family inorganic anion transporter [Chloroflexota bacterium]
MQKETSMTLDFDRKNIPSDAGAGLTLAMVAIPDSIASAILAGVNPVFAFNSVMVGMPVSGLFTGSQFMNCVLTSAMMLVVAGAVAGTGEADMAPLLVTLTILVGLFQLLLGVLKLGGLVRFISNAVMTGFFTGIAVTIILSQLGDLTGYESEAGSNVARAIDLLFNLREIHLPSLVTGVATIAIIIFLVRTPLKNYALILALLVTSLVVSLIGLESVHLVGDSFDISGALPSLALPSLALVPKLLLPAVAIGLIGLIQAAGVSQSIPNPDGKYADPSRDFTGQGIGNTATGFFQGLPVGGSLAGTALAVSAGAKSRWANIFAGLIFIILVLLFGNLVEKIAEPAIAALLIIAGLETIKKDRIADVWDVGMGPRLIMAFTFVATLVLPVQWAVILGVALSFVVHIARASADIEVKEVMRQADGTFQEKPAPEQLSANSITTLQVWGHLFFSGAFTLDERLPEVGNAQRAVVILRMRGRSQIGSTLIKVLERYAQQLQANGGKLMLAGVGEHVLDQLRKTETFETIPEEDIFMATDTLGGATVEALAAAEKWLEE